MTLYVSSWYIETWVVKCIILINTFLLAHILLPGFAVCCQAHELKERNITCATRTDTTVTDTILWPNKLNYCYCWPTDSRSLSILWGRHGQRSYLYLNSDMQAWGVVYSAAHSLYSSSVSRILGLKVCTQHLTDIVPVEDVGSSHSDLRADKPWNVGGAKSLHTFPYHSDL